MNKHELIDAVAEKTGLTKKDTAVIVDMVFDTIEATLVSGESVQVSGFGSFEIKNRAAKMARNPRTGEAVQVAPAKTPDFKPSKSLKDKVNQ